jgi:hypothetical protein
MRGRLFQRLAEQIIEQRRKDGLRIDLAKKGLYGIELWAKWRVTRMVARLIRRDRTGT